MYSLKIRTTEETSRKVAGIVKEYLNAWFEAEGLVFDPIVVIPRFFEDEEYLEIYVVYDGDGDRLDADCTITLPRLIRDRMTDEEISGPLPISYVEKSEWEAMTTDWARYNESARFY